MSFFTLWCLAYEYQTKNLVEKRERKIHDICEDRTRGSKIGHRDHFITRYSNKHPYDLVLFFGVRTTHRTHMHSSTAEKRGVVMTTDGLQTPLNQLDIQ